MNQQVVLHADHTPERAERSVSASNLFEPAATPDNSLPPSLRQALALDPEGSLINEALKVAGREVQDDELVRARQHVAEDLAALSPQPSPAPERAGVSHSAPYFPLLLRLIKQVGEKRFHEALKGLARHEAQLQKVRSAIRHLRGEQELSGQDADAARERGQDIFRRLCDLEKDELGKALTAYCRLAGRPIILSDQIRVSAAASREGKFENTVISLNQLQWTENGPALIASEKNHCTFRDKPYKVMDDPPYLSRPWLSRHLGLKRGCVRLAGLGITADAVMEKLNRAIDRLSKG